MVSTHRAPATASADDPTPTTRSRDVRSRLVDVAAELFARHGFEGTSVQTVVEAAGVTKGAMYHHFTSKDDLLYEIYARVLRTQINQLLRIAELDLPVDQRVHAAAVDVVESTIASLDDSIIFFRSMHQLGPDKQMQVRAERRRYHERFRDMIEEGQRTGVFSSAVPADLVVDYHFGAVHHLSTWYREGGPWRATDVGNYFADMLLSALRP
ncbi:TetR/AcrR family transcriptional regulator [Lipingzhangella sp. LS1_29]|uniref:TetR/AcrR family transcriptional regulator n=1 Tax=Lipingzhangella rawalii TaxID=2055835 RepID=A0ABU2HAA5_9ACTN|nr:TetR/AcrR family transcriptional regulator [Lipingzhangella rawalii]MDS1271534.1 TetR/AcrR family transcriptional regulator [Lipingzhangella rawalii]